MLLFLTVIFVFFELENSLHVDILGNRQIFASLEILFRVFWGYMKFKIL